MMLTFLLLESFASYANFLMTLRSKFISLSNEERTKGILAQFNVVNFMYIIDRLCNAEY